jgi:hypothetical protein
MFDSLAGVKMGFKGRGADIVSYPLAASSRERTRLALTVPVFISVPAKLPEQNLQVSGKSLAKTGRPVCCHDD